METRAGIKKPTHKPHLKAGFLNFGLVCAQKAPKSLLKANKREKKLLEGLKSLNKQLLGLVADRLSVKSPPKKVKKAHIEIKNQFTLFQRATLSTYLISLSKIKITISG